MKNSPLLLALTSAVVLLCGSAAPVSAQFAVPPPMADYQPLADLQLDQLLGPIALYPDPLLAQILPAATLPLQIVLADRYVTGGGDPGQIEQQPWDASVQAVAHYPSVLQYLSDNLAWTTELGQAFLNQQPEVMASIQRLRQSARNFGNLVSTPQEQVVDDGGSIEILPGDDNVVYVPVYQPDDVFYQGGYGLGFGAAFSLGPWLNCDFDWQAHELYFWDRNQRQPANWWHERPEQRHAWMATRKTEWHPDAHRNSAAVQRGDRGWATPAHNSIIVNMSHPGAVPRPAAMPRPMATPRTAAVPRPSAVHESRVFAAAQMENHPAPASHGPANSAFDGWESGPETRAASTRGQQSMQSVTHSEPAHTAPPAAHAAPSSSGGGSRGSSSHSRH